MMPSIRYVCLSDMHLGEEDSLLTNLKIASTDTDPTRPSPVMEKLVACLRSLISENEDTITSPSATQVSAGSSQKTSPSATRVSAGSSQETSPSATRTPNRTAEKEKKPTLILNGDILELALATDNEAAMVFERFIELIMPPGKTLFERIIYIPGNHDHHLWESARETQYVNHISTLKPGSPLPIPWHTTNMFVENAANPVPAYFLTNLVQRSPHLKEMVIAAAYPNFGLLSPDARKCVIFHHGHFIEALYHLMSTLRTLLFSDRRLPTRVWDIEAENFAWIDFFWSTLGRSGAAGQDVELIYEKMQDPRERDKLLSTLATNLAKRYDLPGWGDTMEAKLLTAAFKAIADKIVGRERAQTSSPLSQEAEKGLWTYMNGPLREQVDLELKGNMPSEVTLVFGHTHKPFQEDMNFKGFPQWVNVYNTGGWVVETVKAEPVHGGAIVLVDENLDAVSLRMYNESDRVQDYAVRVEQAKHPGDPDNPLVGYVRQLLERKDKATLWKDFSDTVARAVSVRAQNLRARINEKA